VCEHVDRPALEMKRLPPSVWKSVEDENYVEVGRRKPLTAHYRAPAEDEACRRIAHRPELMSCDVGLGSLSARSHIGSLRARWFIDSLRSTLREVVPTTAPTGSPESGRRRRTTQTKRPSANLLPSAEAYSSALLGRPTKWRHTSSWSNAANNGAASRSGMQTDSFDGFPG